LKTIYYLLFVLVLTLNLTACGAKPAPAASQGEGSFDVNKFVGTYEGTWTNTSTGASGPAKIIIVDDPEKHVATLTIDFDGNYLGIENPPAQTMPAPYDDTQAHVQGNNPLFGDYDVTIAADGNIIGVMKNLAGGMIPEMTYTGKIGDGRLDADYKVTFADGKVSESILRLTKK